MRLKKAVGNREIFHSERFNIGLKERARNKELKRPSPPAVSSGRAVIPSVLSVSFALIESGLSRPAVLFARRPVDTRGRLLTPRDRAGFASKRKERNKERMKRPAEFRRSFRSFDTPGRLRMQVRVGGAERRY